MGVTTLGAAASTAAAAGKGTLPEAGFYSGSVGVYSVTFTVAGGRVTGLTTDFQADNGSSGCMQSSEAVQAKLPSAGVKGGSFHSSTLVHLGSGIAQSLKIKGTFSSSTKVRGSVTTSYTIPSLPPCHDTQSFTATRVGSSAQSAVSVLKVTGATGTTESFSGVRAEFTSLVAPVSTPTLGASGVVWVFLDQSTLSSADEQVVKSGRVAAASLHLVLVGSPPVNASYKFAEASIVGITNPTGQAVVVELSYTNVTTE